MRSDVHDILPPRVLRSLQKLGKDIAIARRKRAFTVQTMAERSGVARTTYLKLEKGDPSVSLGVYAMALFVLGFEEALGNIADPQGDETGLVLDVERLPKRVRMKKKTSAAL
jgi:transcriptional regulator with XRE-family HTH domain